MPFSYFARGSLSTDMPTAKSGGLPKRTPQPARQAPTQVCEPASSIECNSDDGIKAASAVLARLVRHP